MTNFSDDFSFNYDELSREFYELHNDRKAFARRLLEECRTEHQTRHIEVRQMLNEFNRENKQRAHEVADLIKNLKDESAQRAIAWKECLRIIQGGKKELRR